MPPNLSNFNEPPLFLSVTSPVNSSPTGPARFRYPQQQVFQYDPSPSSVAGPDIYESSMTRTDINEQNMRINGELLQEALEWASFLDGMRKQHKADEDTPPPQQHLYQRNHGYGHQHQAWTRHSQLGRRSLLQARQWSEGGASGIFQKAGLAFFLGLLPVIGTLVCCLLSCFKVYLPLSKLRIRESQRNALCRVMQKSLFMDVLIGLLFPVGPFIRLYTCSNLRIAREGKHLVTEHADQCTQEINLANSSFSRVHSPMLQETLLYSRPIVTTPTTSITTVMEAPIMSSTGMRIRAVLTTPEKVHGKDIQQRQPHHPIDQVFSAPLVVSAPARLERQRDQQLNQRSLRMMIRWKLGRETGGSEATARPLENWLKRIVSAVRYAGSTGNDPKTSIDVSPQVAITSDEVYHREVKALAAESSGEATSTTTAVAAAIDVADAVTARPTSETQGAQNSLLPAPGQHPRRNNNREAMYRNPTAWPVLLSSTNEHGCEGAPVSSWSLTEWHRNIATVMYTDASGASSGSGISNAQTQVKGRLLLRSHHSQPDLRTVPYLDPLQQQYPFRQHEQQHDHQNLQYFPLRPVIVSPRFRNKHISYTGPVQNHSIKDSLLYSGRTHSTTSHPDNAFPTRVCLLQEQSHINNNNHCCHHQPQQQQHSGCHQLQVRKQLLGRSKTMAAEATRMRLLGLYSDRKSTPNNSIYNDNRSRNAMNTEVQLEERQRQMVQVIERQVLHPDQKPVDSKVIDSNDPSTAALKALGDEKVIVSIQKTPSKPLSCNKGGTRSVFEDANAGVRVTG